jgi:hypothetical protein
MEKLFVTLFVLLVLVGVAVQVSKSLPIIHRGFQKYGVVMSGFEWDRIPGQSSLHATGRRNKTGQGDTEKLECSLGLTE